MTNHPQTTVYCMDCGHHFVAPRYCKNRFCPICSRRRTKRIRARLNQLISTLDLTQGYSIKFLTLTIPNCLEANTGARSIIRSFRRLRQTRIWKSSVRGGCFVIEATGRPGSWHVHLHAACEAKFIPWEVLHRLWMRYSSGRGVYIQRIPKQATIGYLTKYLTKPAVHVQEVHTLNEELKDFRLFQPFGLWCALLPKPTIPKFKCPVCGSQHWMLESAMRRHSHRVYCKPFVSFARSP